MPNYHILIIGFVWPEPGSSAAGTRMLELIRLFKAQDWTITFASAALDSDHMADLDALDITRVRITLNDSGFDAFVKQLNPSVVLFDRFMTEEQFGWRVAENCPDALRLLDTEDLHCLRHARHLGVKESREVAVADLYSDIAKREVASILRSDISLMISEVEMDLLRDVFKVDGALLYYLPFLLEQLDDTIVNSWPLFEDREGFAFIGNFHHEPNRDAVLFLREKAWTVIRQLSPKAVMNVYGAYIPPMIAQLHKPALGFYIKGRVEDSHEVVRNARVVLAPLRFGAGIKGKLTEAMICGTPSVTTSIGAESMHGDLEWNGYVIDDVQAFAKAAVSLYNDKPLWNNAQKNGIEIINTRFHGKILGDGFVLYLNAIMASLKEHRLKNFTGSMLLHQTMAATKYMSRWIEEKNKAGVK